MKTRNTHLERLAHRHPRKSWWPLWELSYELIEKLLCPDLELEGVPAVLDERVEELDRQRMRP